MQANLTLPAKCSLILRLVMQEIDIGLIRESALLIRAHFGVEEKEILKEGEQNDYVEVHKRLTRVVSYLLDNDFQRLLNGLYKVDVDETKVKQCFAMEMPSMIAPAIATLILERELQKCVIRQHYKGKA
jgi:hypothetical protein